MKDPIVEEVRRIRAGIAAAHGDDLHRIFENARRLQGADGRQVVSFVLPERQQESSAIREDPPAP